MLLIIPEYYKRFTCIADKCKDSCCVGWEIDIDEETYEYYKEVEGEFGERLRNNISVGQEDISFILKKGDRCPFLNEKNLCDIYTELGDTSLCEVCMEYPRFTTEYGDIREKCLGLSCEAAGELIFEKESPIQFEVVEIPEEFECEEDIEPYEEWREDHDEGDEEYSEEFYFDLIKKARDHAIYILQYRGLPLRNRISIFLLFSKEIQEVMEHDEIEIILEKIEAFQNLEQWSEDLEKREIFSEERLHQGFRKRMEIFSRMEILDEEWRGYYGRLIENFSGNGVKSEQYLDYLRSFDAYYSTRGYEYEHLMVYFTFRYFMKSVYDKDFLGKAKFAVAGYLLVHDMDVLRYRENAGAFTKADRVDVARIFSKEVEHSEDNLDMLAGEFLVQPVFGMDELIGQVLG